MSSARYEGAWPDNDEKRKHASLKSTRRWTGSQCNWRNTGEMWSPRLVPVRSRTAVFWTGWTFRMLPWDAVKQWVTIVQATRYKRLDKCSGCFMWQWPEYWMKLTQVVETRPAQHRYVCWQWHLVLQALWDLCFNAKWIMTTLHHSLLDKMAVNYARCLINPQINYVLNKKQLLL